jgi:hypothetical protein
VFELVEEDLARLYPGSGAVLLEEPAKARIVDVLPIGHDIELVIVGIAYSADVKLALSVRSQLEWLSEVLVLQAAVPQAVENLGCDLLPVVRILGHLYIGENDLTSVVR